MTIFWIQQRIESVNICQENKFMYQGSGVYDYGGVSGTSAWLWKIYGKMNGEKHHAGL